MSRGFGVVERFILDRLDSVLISLSGENLGYAYFRESDAQGGNTVTRSVRNSVSRALRKLERAGLIKRDARGRWLHVARQESIAAEKAEAREATAIHEAGHAVIGRAVDIVTQLATIIPRGNSSGHVSRHYVREVGDVWVLGDGDWPVVANEDRAGLDAFGHAIRHEPYNAENEILFLMAGGIAQRELLGMRLDWNDHRYSSDIKGTKRHARFLIDPQSPSYYDERCTALVRQHKVKIRRVADALLEHETLSGNEIDAICVRAVRKATVGTKRPANRLVAQMRRRV